MGYNPGKDGARECNSRASRWTVANEDEKVEYRYCPSCGGALTERIEYVGGGSTVKSWLRYEYEGLDLLRIDERYDDDQDGIDSGDPWRPMNTYVHGPGAIGQIVKANWYKYDEGGANPTTACESGEYYYFYDALGNVNGVLEEKSGLYHYYKWEMDAFGNDLPGGNDFLPMDQSGPKEHLTGKMYDTVTGLYYFHARWYDPEAGRFVSKDPSKKDYNLYAFVYNNPTVTVDPTGLETIDCSCQGDIIIFEGSQEIVWKPYLINAVATAKVLFRELYPNADKIEFARKKSASELKSYIESSDTIGIIFFGHGYKGYLDITRGGGLSTFEVDSKSDLQFFVSGSCYFMLPNERGGKSFCDVSHAGYCNGYRGEGDVTEWTEKVYDWYRNIKKKCK